MTRLEEFVEELSQLLLKFNDLPTAEVAEELELQACALRDDNDEDEEC